MVLLAEGCLVCSPRQVDITWPDILDISGTPAQVARTPEDATLSLDGNRSRRKNTPGDQSMRRTIQDLVASVDPNVKIEPEVEDVSISTILASY